ncbi:MAG TPA: DUF3570 domain-containing protein, partial [Thiobacillus sp.]|nr:DUF3570 domain-containing protein [Thiobacillus sp.]
ALLLFLAGFLAYPCTGLAAVLPDDRADALYHYYDGGGVTVRGPALLVRKSVADTVSLSGRYYVDTISSASIDVVTTASPYKDKREEFGAGIDYLHGNSLIGVTLSSSNENDYLADSFGLNVSHDLPGGLTTINLGYSQGHDIVQRVDTSFEAEINRYNFRLGVSQVLTRSLLLGVNFEGIAEDGYLSNPYRSARILGASLPERYPGTRDSQALAVRAVQAFSSGSRPVISSLRAEYRYFRDNWGIRSNTLAFALQRYFGDRVLGEARYRYYQQSAASFYSDNFTTEMVYMARDKELSTFTGHSLGYKVSWKFLDRKYFVFDRMSLNFSHDYINFDYQDFTDVRTGEAYSFGANVLQLFVSAWY